MSEITMEEFEKIEDLTLMRKIKNDHIENQLGEILSLIKKTKSFSTALELKEIYEKLTRNYDGIRKEMYESLHIMITNYIFSMKYQPITEKDVHEWFEKHFYNIVSDGKIIEHEHNLDKGKFRADYLCEVYGKRTIVEIKKGEINKKALKQIKNYMNLSKASFGILVGDKLKTDLPKNVLFISYRDGISE